MAAAATPKAKLYPLEKTSMYESANAPRSVTGPLILNPNPGNGSSPISHIPFPLLS